MKFEDLVATGAVPRQIVDRRKALEAQRAQAPQRPAPSRAPARDDEDEEELEASNETVYDSTAHDGEIDEDPEGDEGSEGDEGDEADRAVDWKAEYAKQRAENVALRKRPRERAPAQEETPAAAATRAIKMELESPDISAEEMAEFPDSYKFIEKIVKREIKQAVDKLLPLINTQLGEIDATVRTVGGTLISTTDRAFREQLAAAVPNLTALRRSRKFQEYLDREPEEAPSGVTRRALLSTAVQTHDLPSIKKIINKFNKTHPGAVGTEPTRDVSSFTRPSQAAQPSTRSMAQKKPGGMKLSEYREGLKKFQRGALNQTAYQELKTRFNAAKASGTLVDDVEPRESTRADKERVNY
jgi:hypothetical protein